MNFTWIPFYEELARKIAPYEKRSKDLVELLAAVLQEQGMSVDWLRDKDAEGARIALDAFDPFTFFAAFNRGITEVNRIGILNALKQRLNISASVPTDFIGIPVADNRNAWFFDFLATRKADAISNLWSLFLECLGKSIHQVTPGVYEKVAESAGVGKTTMGLFWVKPSEYLSLDSVMRTFLEDNLKELHLEKANTRDGYAETIQAVRGAFPGRQFCNISYEAWTTKQKGKPTHWILALGKGSEFWDDCHAKGIVRVGWDAMKTDLSMLDPDQLERLHTESKEGDFKGIKDFVAVMKPGDRVFIKQGISKIIAYGEITGGTPETEGREYCFKPTLDTYRHIRPTKWLKTGSWDIPEGVTKLPQKTLTSVTQQARVQELLSLIGWQSKDDMVEAKDLLAGLNVILYGPPGTGKTYQLRHTYFPLFTERKTKTKDEFAEELVSALSWWEIVAVAVYDLSRPKISVSDILAHPLVAARVRLTSNKHPRAAVWATLQIHTKEDCALVNYSQRSSPLIFSKEPDSMWTLDRQAVENEFPELLEVPKKIKEFTPIQSEIRRYRFVTFHQSFCYEDFVEGIKPVVRMDASDDDESDDGRGDIAYTVKKGVFQELVEEARKDPSHEYALFIDEINRGNVANIFGELITFIEEDKRLDASGNLEAGSSWTATLPYSRRRFGVPNNLYVIGTMNTADRSIEALDTALRRRFSFIPTYPKPALLRDYQPHGFGVNLESLLRTINDRLEMLLDRDHTIGHSYLMSLKDAPDPLAKLQRVFANNILPLLQEYFYGNPARIGMVLGSAFVTKRGASAKLAKGDWDTSEAEEKEIYDITPQEEWTLSVFQSVYA
jgi:hypothetical protein